MKTISELLQEKERQLEKLQKEIEALRLVSGLIRESGEVAEPNRGTSVSTYGGREIGARQFP